MAGKLYLNKVLKEGVPHVIYLVSILLATAISEVGTWATILALNAVIAIAASYDFGRNQMIIAGLSRQTVAVGVYALSVALFVPAISKINEGMSVGLLLVAILAGQFTVYLQHAASLLSVSGKDGRLQFLSIVLSISRGLGVVVAALLDSPVALLCFYGIGLVLGLFQFRIEFDSKITEVLKGKSEFSIALISVIGLASISFDRIVYYHALDAALVKPYSVISTLFLGAMFLSALWFRMQNSRELNGKVLYRLIVFAFVAYSLLIFSGVFAYQGNGSTRSILTYAAVMSIWGWLNIASQSGYRSDYRRGVYFPRLCAVAMIPLVVILIYVFQPRNAVLTYWVGMVASQFTYFAVKGMCDLNRPDGRQ